jgi:integrase
VSTPISRTFSWPSSTTVSPSTTRTTVRSIAQWAETVWLPRKVPPLVRRSLADTYRKHLRNHLLPRFGSQYFADVTVGALADFRIHLVAPVDVGQGLSPKTARDIIDGTFRALYRDAREEGLAAGDPFAGLRWPRRVTYEPDPFTEAERDALCAYFRHKHPDSYPLVYTLFQTGLRTGEVVGLRWCAVDLRAGTLTVHISRSHGEDNPPKTKNSQRTITLQPDVVAVLRATQPLHVTPESFVFITPTGLPLDTDGFVELRWHRALRATGTRPRKFYTTRHTFISVALSRGCKPKWVAKYCGTSLEMLDKHYGRWMDDDRGQLDLLMTRRWQTRDGGRKPGPFPGPNRAAGASTRSGKRRGGDSNSDGVGGVQAAQVPEVIALQRFPCRSCSGRKRPKVTFFGRKRCTESARQSRRVSAAILAQWSRGHRDGSRCAAEARREASRCGPVPDTRADCLPPQLGPTRHHEARPAHHGGDRREAFHGRSGAGSRRGSLGAAARGAGGRGQDEDHAGHRRRLAAATAVAAGGETRWVVSVHAPLGRPLLQKKGLAFKASKASERGRPTLSTPPTPGPLWKPAASWTKQAGRSHAKCTGDRGIATAQGGDGVRALREAE